MNRRPAKLTLALLAFLFAQAPALANIPCAGPLRKVYYKAGFDWKKSPMTMTVGRDRRGEVIVQLRSDNGCEATCQIRGLEDDGIELGCRSFKFSPLTSPAMLFISHEISSPSFMRFGSWLEGYEQTRLSVAFDHLDELYRSQRVESLTLVKAEETTQALLDRPDTRYSHAARHGNVDGKFEPR